MAAPRPQPEIPAEVLEVLRVQVAALAKVSVGQKSRLLAIARDVVAELEAALRRLAPGKFTTQQTRVKLVQTRAIVDILGAELGERIGNEVQAIGAVAARIGRDGLIDQIAAWSSTFPGSVRRISPAELAGDVLDQGLLEYYETSRQTYGMEAITRMRGALARGVLNGETIQQTTENLAAEIALPEARAERIVRTESSFAAHRRQIEDAKAADLDLAKMLISTFDNRTGADSVFVHEQVRELDEPFSDNEGRVYQHPPNRPNDRETVVFVPNSLNELGPPAEDDTGEEEEVPVRQPAEPLVPAPSVAATVPPRLFASGLSAMVGPRKGPPGLPFDDPDKLAAEGDAWAAKMSAEQRSAVKRWSTDWRPLLDGWVNRSKPGVQMDDVEQAYALVSALHTAPRWTGRLLRGIRGGEIIDDRTNKPIRLQAGEPFTLNALRAFSMREDVARGFAAPAKARRDGVGLIIDVVKGSKKGTPFIASAVDEAVTHQAECLQIEARSFRILKVHEPETITRSVDGSAVSHVVRRIEVEAL